VSTAALTVVPAPPGTTGSGVRAVTARRVRVAAAWLLGAAVVLPVVVAGVAGATREWLPGGDWAVLELRTRDVGGPLTPLVGPYSRFGWNHPGPLLFWVLAVPYRALGGASSSLLVGAAAVNAVALGALVAFAWRRGRLPLVALAVALVGLMATHLGPAFLRDPWNPSVTVLPFLLFVVLAWSAAEGDRVAMPVGAGVGSFLVQAHVGFAVLVAVLGAWAVAGFVRRWREATGGADPARTGFRPARATLWGTVAVLLVCWLPVLVDQVAGTGNLGALVRHFTGGKVPAAGISLAAGIVARELGDVAPWLGGAEPGGTDGELIPSPLRALVVPIAAFVAAALVARGAGARSALRLQATVGLAAVAGWFSVARISGEVFAYLVRWWWAIALLWWLAVLWSVWSALPGGLRSTLEPVVAALGGAVALWCAVVVIAGVGRVGTPDGEWWVPLEGVVPGTVAAAPRDGPVLVRAVGSKWGSVGDGVRLQLERAGVDVVVDDTELIKYGDGRRAKDRPPVAVVWVVTGTDAIGAWSARSGLREVARWDPLDPAERASFDEAATALKAQLLAAGRADMVEALATGGSLDAVRGDPAIDGALFDRVERDRRKGDPVAVFIGPVEDRDAPS
jgi:hypothetical protein